MTARDHDDRGRVRIPADVERPDKLLAGLTARQLAILGVAAVALVGRLRGDPPRRARARCTA